MSDASEHAAVDPAPYQGVSLCRLGAAAHRLPFFAGVTNVLLAMVWWAAWLVASRWPEVLTLDYPPVFPGWLHAFVMQYQMLPAFFFGFLLTTFPKWTKQPDVARRRYLPVGIALIAGQLVTLAGALGSRAAISVGVALTLVGWIAGLSVLAPFLWREKGVTWHARSCIAALVLGVAGIVAFGAYVLGASAAWVAVSIKLGSYGMLLMIFFTVAHRMFPFFAGNVVAGYQPWRPMWLLAGVWIAVLIRLALVLTQAFSWLWIPDAALVVLTCVAAWRWWPRGRMPGLLAVLFIAFAWLPIAMLLYLADDLARATGSLVLLGRAPAHALFIGFFGSALIAMVTRVSQGHAGRPLVMPAIAWFAFIAIQLVAVVRIIGELTRDPNRWYAIAAIGWLVAFAPWAIRLGRIYLLPRADKKPG